MTMLDNYCLKRPSHPSSPEDVGCRTFLQFKLFRLDIQYRSVDPLHSANLLSLRTFCPTEYPFTKKLLSSYKRFCHADVIADPSWLMAPVAVLYNRLRHYINLEALKNYAKIMGYPIIAWRNPLHGANAASLTAAEINQLYKTHIALSGFFVPGAPSYGKQNINCSIGLFNGARQKLHSITFDPHEEKVSLFQKLSQAQPGDLIVLEYPPLSVNVEILDATPDMYLQADSLVQGKYVVPLKMHSKSCHEPIKSYELLSRLGKPIQAIKYRCIPYDLGWSLTFEKTQSKSFQKIILDLQLWPSLALTAEKTLVGLSRVEKAGDLRILPFAPSQTEHHLYKLKPNISMLHWFSGFGPDGMWDPELTKQAIAHHPLPNPKKERKNAATHNSNKKKTAKNSSNKATASQKTTSQTSISKKTTKQSQAGTKKHTNSTTHDQPVSQFQLNITQAIQEDSDKIFHAFSVPEDGHCLFNAMRKTLLLETSVSDLRQQVVDFYSNNPDPSRRLTALNEHILREAEHRNPVYTNVPHFDAGTVHVPGQIDQRFETMYLNYVADMTSNSWAGSDIKMFTYTLILFSKDSLLQFLVRTSRNNCIGTYTFSKLCDLGSATRTCCVLIPPHYFCTK
jgi:hypothetical protein